MNDLYIKKEICSETDRHIQKITWVVSGLHGQSIATC